MILPLERAGQLLARVQRVFGSLTSSNTNDTLQAIQRALAPQLAAHRDVISLNDTLFQRIRSLYDRRDSLGLDSLQRRVVERYYRDFVRAGALLSDAEKTRLRALNREQASLTNDFGRRRENGQRFRDMILSQGGSGDVAAMYRAFREAQRPVGQRPEQSSGTAGIP